MKIVIAGGTGQIGGILRRAWAGRGHEVVVVSRHPATLEDGVRHAVWDGRAPGPWADEVDGADVVVNLAGRSIACRYTARNKQQLLGSRLDSTRAVGEAIARASSPPALWLQASAAGIYPSSYVPTDEDTDVSRDEPGVPSSWTFTVDLVRRWEAALTSADTPHTRKVALRSGIVASPDEGSAFDLLLRLTRLGAGGPVAGGRQYVSWIHDHDVVRALDHVIAHDEISGPVNLSSPEPLPQRDFALVLRRAWGTPIGLPATAWMAEIGTRVLGAESELILKSRRVMPERLLDSGFTFEHPDWHSAAHDLVARVRHP